MAETILQNGNGTNKRKFLGVLVSVGLVVAVAAFAAGLGVGARWLQHKHAHDHDDEPAAGNLVTFEEVDKAHDLIQEGEYDKARESIDKALERSNISTQEKHDLLVQKAIAYENEQNDDAALEVYYQAEAVQESLQVAQSIANIADRQGNKELAIAYFKKAITLVPNNAAGEMLKEYFEGRLAHLEGRESAQ